MFWRGDVPDHKMGLKEFPKSNKRNVVSAFFGKKSHSQDQICLIQDSDESDLFVVPIKQLKSSDLPSIFLG